MVNKTASKTENKGLNNDEILTAILSYLSILVLIPLFTIDVKKRNDFIKFHLEQGLNLFIVEIIIWVAVSILSIITFGVFGILGAIINVILLIVCIIAIIKAMQKEKWEIPVLSSIKLIKL